MPRRDGFAAQLPDYNKLEGFAIRKGCTLWKVRLLTREDGYRPKRRMEGRRSRVAGDEF
jgi:hypothetical protein